MHELQEVHAREQEKGMSYGSAFLGAEEVVLELLAASQTLYENLIDSHNDEHRELQDLAEQVKIEGSRDYAKEMDLKEKVKQAVHQVGARVLLGEEVIDEAKRLLKRAEIAHDDDDSDDDLLDEMPEPADLWEGLEPKSPPPWENALKLALSKLERIVRKEQEDDANELLWS